MKKHMKDLELRKYNVKRFIYPDGMKLKFDNRSVAICDADSNSLMIQFRKIKDYGDEFPPHVISELIRGKMIVTTFSLSHEAAEALMLLLQDFIYDRTGVMGVRL